MKATPAVGIRSGRKHRAVVVENPRLTVVEIPDVADPGAVEDALALLVKWAVRARKHAESAPVEAATVECCASCAPEN